MLPAAIEVSAPRALRRLDWRFLLPRPAQGRFSHLLLMGGLEGIAETAVELGVAQRVSEQLSGCDRADLVAFVGGTWRLAQLDTAVRLLGADGTIYVEVDRRRSSMLLLTPGRLRRHLAKVGLPSSAAYWIKPSLDIAEMYLPADPPAALGWYLDTLFTPITPMRRFGRWLLRTVATLAPRVFWWLVPSYAVVGRARGSVGPWIVSRVQGTRDYNASQAVMLTDNGERSVLLALSDGRPSVAIKIAKRPEFGPKTIHEHEVLVELHGTVGREIAAALPRPIALTDEDGLAVTAEGIVDGTSLLSSVGTWPFDRRRQTELLGAAADWLIRFHTATIHRRIALVSDAADELIWTPVRRYRQTFGLPEHEDRLERRLASLVRAYGDLTVPVIWEHGDFGVQNVWRSPEGIRVIDWEGGRRGPALCDLLYFAASWNDTAHGVKAIEGKLVGFRRLFIDRGPPDPRAAAVRHQVLRYCDSLQLTPTVVPILLVVTWSRLALGRHARLGALGEARPDPRIGNEATAYVDLMDRNVDELTATWR